MSTKSPQELQADIQEIKNKIYELQKTSFNSLKDAIGSYIQNYGIIQVLISEQETINIDQDNFQNIIISNVEEDNSGTDTSSTEEAVTANEIETNNLDELKDKLAEAENNLKNSNATAWTDLSNSIISYINDYDTYLAIQSPELNNYYLPNVLEAYGIVKQEEKTTVLSVNIINTNIQDVDNIIIPSDSSTETETQPSLDGPIDNDILFDDNVEEIITTNSENLLFWKSLQESLYNFLIQTNQSITIYNANSEPEQVGKIDKDNYINLLREINTINFSTTNIGITNSNDETIE